MKSMNTMVSIMTLRHREKMTLQEALSFFTKNGYKATWKGIDENGRMYIMYKRDNITTHYPYRMTIFA